MTQTIRTLCGIFTASLHILGDLAWYSLVSTTIARGRRFMSDRFYRGLVAACAAFLAAFAGSFVFSGVQHVIRS